MARWRGVAYWMATGVIAAELLVGGVYDVFQWPPAAAELFDATGLGLPRYFGMIIGTWKLLGAVALLVPRYPLLKEWAYAGFTFTMTGAIATNLAVGAAPDATVGAASVLLIGAASWWLRPTSRRLVQRAAPRDGVDTSSRSVIGVTDPIRRM
jgi:hypothetical protein